MFVISKAEKINFDSIKKINDSFNWRNPDTYIKRFLDDGMIFIAENDGEVVAYLLYELIW